MMLLAMRPDQVNPPIDPTTGLIVTHVKSRIDGLIKELEKAKIKIIVPTPAFSELLVRAGDATPALISTIEKSSIFRTEPFDKMAAIEVAMMTRLALENGGKRGGIDCPWQKVKYDRQIIAIAKVHGATAIYSDDGDIHTHGETAQIKVIRVADLPIPQDAAQAVLELDKKVIVADEENQAREITETEA